MEAALVVLVLGTGVSHTLSNGNGSNGGLVDVSEHVSRMSDGVDACVCVGDPAAAIAIESDDGDVEDDGIWKVSWV